MKTIEIHEDNNYIAFEDSIKTNGFFGWLKGFTEPISVMLPMNIISEIAQPVAMAFRHFGNVAGGSVINSILYTALGLLSTAVLGVLSKTVVIPVVLIIVGVLLILLGRSKGKLFPIIFGGICGVLGLLGEVKERGNIILVIDEVHNIVGTGEAEGSVNAANILAVQVNISLNYGFRIILHTIVFKPL